MIYYYMSWEMIRTTNKNEMRRERKNDFFLILSFSFSIAYKKSMISWRRKRRIKTNHTLNELKLKL